MRRLTLFPVLLATAVLLGVSFVVTVLIPASDAANTRRTPDTRQYTVGAVRGMDAYASLGCVTCHTQQVRDAYADAGLASAPTRAVETLNDLPGQLGEARFGPDLSCVGDRVPGVAPDAPEDERVAAMVAYLRAPAEFHPGSVMPGYSFVDSADLRRLATYLVSLRCDDGTQAEGQ